MVKYNEININYNSNVIFKKKNIICKNHNGYYINIRFKDISQIELINKDHYYRIVIYYKNSSTFDITTETRKERDELLNKILSNIG
jgi:hypothetical protein